MPHPPPPVPAGLHLLALAAVGLSTLLAYNVSPSTTFFNQALALAGWGALVWALALARGGWLAPRRLRWAGVGPVLAALALLALGALLPGGAGACAFCTSPCMSVWPTGLPASRPSLWRPPSMPAWRRSQH